MLKINDIYLGDCLDVMGLIDDHSIDLILCDLPYSITSWKQDVLIPFEPLWKQYNRVIKANGSIVLTASQPFTSALIMSNIKMFKYCWIWEKNIKTGFLNAKKQPLRQTEDIVVFYNKQPTYNPQLTFGHKPVNSYTKHTSDGMNFGKTKKISGGGQTTRYPSNILKFDSVKNDHSGEDKLHHNQKPVALLEYLIKTYTDEKNLVLDNCIGSGSTAVAAIKTNRNFIGIEKDPYFFKIAKDRITIK